MKQYTLSFLLIIIVASVGFIKINPVLDRLVADAERYFRQHPMEKVLLHLDKPYYASGDKIWYSAYLVNYQGNTPSLLSEILHINIVDPSGNVITTQKIRLKHGLGNGQIQLADTLPSGYYTINAYTNFMLNYGSDLILTEPLGIVSYTKKLDTQAITKKPLAVNFYPEGKRVVSNTLNRIAFEFNKSKKIKGRVIDGSSNSSFQVESDQNGCGTFKIVPVKGKTYSLEVIDQDDTLSYPLPRSMENGTVLQIDELSSNEFSITAFCSPNYNNKEVFITFQHQGLIVVTMTAQFRNNGLMTEIPKNELPAGLIDINLFDNEGNLLNSRLVQNIPTQKPKLNISSKESYSTRELVKLNLESFALDSISVSMSVIPDKFFRGNSGKFHPTSSNHNPLDESVNERYIKEKPQEYTWEKIKKNQKIAFERPIEKAKSFQFSGDIFGLLNNNINQCLITVKDEDGFDFYFEDLRSNKFSASIPTFYGKRDVFVKPYLQNDSINKELTYILDKPFSRQHQLFAIPEFKEIQYEYSHIVKENSTIYRLYDLTYSIPDKLSIPQRFSFSPLKSPDKIVHLEDYIALPNMEEIAKELLEGVRIRKESKGVFTVVMRGLNPDLGFTQYNSQPPLMLIDGVPIFDTSIIGNLNPLEIESIAMNYADYNIDNAVFYGILSIKTVEGNYGQIKDFNHGYYEFTGFTKPYNFSAPEIGKNAPDFRSLLYWNPEITLAPGQNKDIEFFTSDEQGRYTVYIKGLSHTGDVINQTFEFEVLGNN